MENVRVDSLLGNKKVIVGNPYSDIVLETLGKVYIKSGRNCKLLDDVIKELATITEKPQEEVYAKTIIVNSVDELESLDYPGDGYLIYNSLNKSLYISYEDKYIALIESVADTSENYVKKTGDSMSGQLEITVDAFPPLIVHSKKLVSNFNANYLEGYAAKDLAKKKVDEIISGDWTFTGSNISKANWRFYRDIIVGGSITSPFFSSGFSGSGWRIDATTNTLTIDYLVVRKAMQVYEMVVNKITATNGSLWVSNASKVENFVLAYETTTTEFLNEFNEAYKNASGGTDFTELDDLARSLLTSLLSQRTDIIFTNENVRAYMVGDSSWQCPAILTHIADAYALANSTLFTNINQLWDKSFLDSINIEGPQTPETLAVNNSAQAIDLFSESGPESYMDIVSDDNKSIIKKPLYYSYFYGTENIYVVDFDDDEIPVFKPGDIVRCQKWDNQNIKYYDAIVLAPIGLHSFAIQLAKSVFDKYTEVSYDEKGNISEIVEKYNDNLYDRTDWTPSDDDLDYEGEPVQEEEIKKKLATVEIGDSLVQVGNIKPDSGRQNAIYLTSSDDQAPYINILSDLNRPDYSVLYKIPKYDEEGNPITKKDEEGNFVEYEFEYTKTTKVRIGNLGGIIDYTFPADKQPRGYGLYGQNVYLTGNFYLNNGKSVVDVSQDGIILKYKRAGLGLVDLYDEQGNPVYLTDKDGNIIKDDNGNPVQKQEIKLNAEQIKVGDEETYALFKVVYENGEKKIYLNADLIQASEIYNLKESADASVITTIDNSVSKIPTNAVTDWTYAAKYFFPEYGQTPMWTANYHPDGGGNFSSKTDGTFELTTPSTDFNSYILTNRIEAVATTIGKVTMEMTVTQLTSDISKYEVALLDLENPGNYFVIPLVSNDGVNFKWEKTLNVKMEGDYAVGIQIKSSGVSGTDIYSTLKATIGAEEKSYYWALWSDGSGVLAEERIQWDNLGNLSITASKLTVDDGQYKIELHSSDEGCYLRCFGNNKDVPYAKIGCSFNANFQRYQGFLSLTSIADTTSSDGLFASFNVLSISGSTDDRYSEMYSRMSSGGLLISKTNLSGFTSDIYITGTEIITTFHSGSYVSAGFANGRAPDLSYYSVGEIFRVSVDDMSRLYNGTANVLMIKTS